MILNNVYAHNKFLFHIKSMELNSQNVVTSNNQQVYQYRSTQNLGLPINSRLITESGPNLFLNNYQSYNQPVSPQQVYSYIPQSNTGRTSNIAYQSISNPVTSFVGYPQQSVNYAQQNLIQAAPSYQASTQKIVRSRLVPVTQYVPVYQYENVQTVPLENQTIHQRIIQHEPEAFKSKEVFQQREEVYEEKVQALPTLMEEARLEAPPSRMVNTRVVKRSQDPLVETVQGGAWRSKVSASRTSFPPPAPLPRQQKTCCSGWLLLLLGLIALGGILTAILLGKNSASRQSNLQSATVVAGTKVSSSNKPNKIQEVAPLTNVNFEVKGSTAVTNPVYTSPIQKISSTPVVYVPPTDISQVATTVASEKTQTTYVEPQEMSFVSVQPVVVPYSVAPTTVKSSVAPTITTSSVHPTIINSSSSITPTITTSTITVASVHPTIVNSTSSVAPTFTRSASSVAPTITTSTIPANSVHPTIVNSSSSIAPTITTSTIPASSVHPTIVASSTNTTSVSKLNSAVYPVSVPATIVASSSDYTVPVYTNYTVPVYTTTVTKDATVVNYTVIPVDEQYYYSSVPAVEVTDNAQR